MYERLVAMGFPLHYGQDGWWLGRDHELWLLAEQQRIYGAMAKLGQVGRRALAILLEGTGKTATDYGISA